MKTWILSLCLLPSCLAAAGSNEARRDLQKIDNTLKAAEIKIKNAEPKAMALQKQLIFIEAQLKAYRAARIRIQEELQTKQKEINALRKKEENTKAAIEKSKQRLARWLNYNYRHPPLLPLM